MKKRSVILTCGPVMLTDGCLKWLEKKFKLNVMGCALDANELLKACADSVGIIIGGFEKITLSAVEQLADNAKRQGIKPVLIFLGIQYDTFFTAEALEFCRQEDIPIYFTGEGRAAVAEKTLQVITVWNPLEIQIRQASRGINPSATDRILAGQKILVAGAGIGREVMKGLSKIGIGELRYFKRTPDPYLEKEYGAVFYDKLFAAMRDADVASFHLPLNEATRGMIGYRQFKAMAAGGLVVNASRWGLEDGKGLVRVFKEKLDIREILDANAIENPELAGGFFKRMKEQGMLKLTGHTFALSEETSQERSRLLMRLIEREKLYS